MSLDAFICKRCGKCCESLDRNFWLRSPITDTQPLLKLIKDFTRGFNAIGPCLMLRRDGNGTAYCILHEVFGPLAKPSECIDFPNQTSPCLFEKE